MTAQDIIACAFVGTLIAITGIIYGFIRGRAFGWQSGYFQREHDEKRRRDALGRFKHVET